MKKVETGLQAIYANGIFDLKTNEYISASTLNLLVDYGAFGKAEIKLSNPAVEIYIDGSADKLQYVSGEGFKLETDLSQTSTIKVVYKYNNGASRIELDISYAEGVNVAYKGI